MRPARARWPRSRVSPAEAAQSIVAKLTGAKVTDKAARAAVTGAMGHA